jgi:hypothetical protein
MCELLPKLRHNCKFSTSLANDIQETVQRPVLQFKVIAGTITKEFPVIADYQPESHRYCPFL